jgi:hypothetical protein
MLAKMEHRFKAGDFLSFQIESGFALIRLLGVEDTSDGAVWHVRAFHDLFPDVEMIEQAVSDSKRLSVSIPHVALSNRAFESTQVTDIGHSPITYEEAELIQKSTSNSGREISDVSIRLLTGLR